ncbi:MAG: hypothetical protein IPH30_02885 [Betaproteobacteria bacterium]|nr:hypothetical protein [Betaproteobacteria bacterium]
MNAARVLALAFLAGPVLAAAPSAGAGSRRRRRSLRPGRQGPYRWDAAIAKSAPDPGERRARIGFVRASPKDLGEPAWQAADGGFVARFDVVSSGAAGLRARLDLSGTGEMEVRVRDASGRVESMAVPAGAGVAWGPWTEGARQAVEVFSRARPAPGALRLGGVVHFDQPLSAKAAGACTIDTPCSTGNPALDAAIAERKKAVARITFVEGSQAFACTGTLLNSGKFPEPFFLTANHCVGRAAVAASVTSFWFYEATGCGSGATSPDFRQVAGGMRIEFADPNTDHTLLVMNSAPPSGVTYSAWNAARLANGESVVSISHPAGDVSKWAQASVVGTTRFADWEQSAWLTTFSRGIMQGAPRAPASSRSAATACSCARSSRRRPWAPTARCRARASTSTASSTASTSSSRRSPAASWRTRRRSRTTTATVPRRPRRSRWAPRRSSPPGASTMRATWTSSASTSLHRARSSSGPRAGWTPWACCSTPRGERLDSNDDAQTSANDFGLTKTLGAGTYYLAVSRWESAGTGAYTLALSVSPVSVNYTDLWWNAAESGWGINLNHQGQIVFATLFTYGADGAPDWFVMSNGARQPDGSFRGELYRARARPSARIPGAPSRSRRWAACSFAFPSADNGTLTYTLDGVAVVKQIERQRFSTGTTCSWSAFDRSYANNYQDLWWNPTESGWGVNFAHQGDILFATLFTYGADGRSQWFVMSRGERTPGTRTFRGTLYRTTGPPFDATRGGPSRSRPSARCRWPSPAGTRPRSSTPWTA